ncbi:MAG: NlpC/P60 family protein [Caldimicrobium sp.]|nr:NlpC/P60 family protein [Caldimicrobium sp.]MCX7873289.1 NlpC/P60 family protein [Caldimicrobium sp.]MDW8093473.1 NlpC/P60 family protein [Caldimicrobium sp.]
MANQFSRDHTVHVVAKGENLFRIAKKYNVSLEEIRALNRVSEKNLKIGMELLIPVKTSKDFRERSEELRYGYEVAPSLNYKYHTVQPGETLYRISLRYNVPIEEIQKLNGLEGNLIAVGQKLKIPVRNSNEETTFVLESPGKELKTREDSLPTKFEKNILAKNRILTQAMLSEEDELALKRKFIEISTAYADSRYRLGGVGNGYLDCSAFVKYVFEEIGIKLPRSSAQQFQVGVAVEENELIPGDLVFFRTRGKSISHVGIYIGDNRFIHISSSRKRISIDSLEDPYFKKRYAGAKRVLNGEVLDYFHDYLQRNKGALPREYSIEKKS